MIEIKALTKACGLSEFRYRIFPAPRFDNVPASLLTSEAPPATSVAVAELPPATPQAAPALAQPEPGQGTRAPHSVLREVADLSPAPAAAKTGRPSRAARSAWRAAMSAHQPR